ncbi:hypothetical protein R9X47_04995 [Wukongibacter baidiensis]|uniref:hypothetical protein n=1 Tax=Wukongibacter baidiensis TaxID=1723361 RepID=UPI003D7F59A4
MEVVREILRKVEKGELTSKEAAEMLRSLPMENRKIKYAKKIKIKIYSKEENIRINLPAIPIWIIEKFAFIAVKFSRYHYKSGDEERTKRSERSGRKLKGKEIDVKDLKMIFSSLRFTPPCKLVEVYEDDNLVEIYTI